MTRLQLEASTKVPWTRITVVPGSAALAGRDAVTAPTERAVAASRLRILDICSSPDCLGDRRAVQGPPLSNGPPLRQRHAFCMRPANAIGLSVSLLDESIPDTFE